MITSAPKLISENVEIFQDVVYEICNNNYIDVCLLANTFIKSTRANIDKLELILLNKDFDSIRFAAHACRSSLSIFKFPLLYSTLTDIEQLSKENREDIIISEKLVLAIKLYKAMLELMISTYSLDK